MAERLRPPARRSRCGRRAIDNAPRWDAPPPESDRSRVLRHPQPRLRRDVLAAVPFDAGVPAGRGRGPRPPPLPRRLSDPDGAFCVGRARQSALARRHAALLGRSGAAAASRSSSVSTDALSDVIGEPARSGSVGVDLKRPLLRSGRLPVGQVGVQTRSWRPCRSCRSVGIALGPRSAAVRPGPPGSRSSWSFERLTLLLGRLLG